MRLIEHPDELEAFCLEISSSPWLAIDTEFLREKTFFPKFCLLQIASSTSKACIDPIKLSNLEPLRPILYNSSVVKIFHAARQDLEIFHGMWRSVPAPLFDTQIAAAAIGLPDQIGYASLVEHLLGIKLSKQETRTDWSQRPLSAEQLSYALNDVHHLGALYVHLCEKLTQLNRMNWVTEDSEKLSDPRLYLSDPDLAWKRIKGFTRLNPRARRTLCAVAKWREEKAAEKNIPRNWLIRDEAICELARICEKEILKEQVLRVLQKERIQNLQLDLLDCLEHAQKDNSHPRIVEPTFNDLNEDQQRLLKQLSILIETKSMELEIQPSLLATKKDQINLITRKSNSTNIEGWRANYLMPIMKELDAIF